MTEATINGQSIQIKTDGETVLLNGQELSTDISQVSPELWHLLLNNKSYHIFVQKVDQEARTVTLSVNGKKAEVKLVSRMEKLLKDLGMASQLTKKLEVLKAPMPGLIHKINVSAGDTVSKGDPLLILEAMKMENVIKSPGDATIKEVMTAVGTSVEKNAVLIRFE